MTNLLALDVDGVVLPFDHLPPPETPALFFGEWGTPLELLDRVKLLRETVEFVWLTTWRQLADDHFGPYIGHAPVLPMNWSDRGWWKAKALVEFLKARPDVRSVVWCDDHLNRFHRRRKMVRDFCSERGIRLLDLCPDRSTGLTMDDLDTITEFFQDAAEAGPQ